MYKRTPWGFVWHRTKYWLFSLIMHVYWRINKPFEGLSGFGQLGEFLPENKSFNAQTVGLHVRRPVYTFHIEVEGLQNYKLVCETHFKQIPTLVRISQVIYMYLTIMWVIWCAFKMYMYLQFNIFVMIWCLIWANKHLINHELRNTDVLFEVVKEACAWKISI